MILYYTDVDETLGPTYVVSQDQRHARSYLSGPRSAPARKILQALQARSRPVPAAAGNTADFLHAHLPPRPATSPPTSAHASLTTLVYRSGGITISPATTSTPTTAKIPQLRRLHRPRHAKTTRSLGFPKPRRSVAGIKRQWRTSRCGIRKWDATPYRVVRRQIRRGSEAENPPRNVSMGFTDKRYAARSRTAATAQGSPAEIIV